VVQHESAPALRAPRLCSGGRAAGLPGRRPLGDADAQDDRPPAGLLAPLTSMRPVSERIEDLDIGLFDAIPSQTSADTRRSLLAVHRAPARRHPAIAYLEIGSHLGGSLQPYLLDPRCRAIYSIDPRPAAQKDDRAPGFVAAYGQNSTARMLALLRELAP